MIGFAALFLRLWALQVLAGSHYVGPGRRRTQVRTVRVQAPRGPIVDSNGRIARHQQAGHRGRALGRPACRRSTRARRRAPQRSRTSRVCRCATRSQADRGAQASGDFLDPIVVRSDAPAALVTYLQERALSQFPGRQSRPRPTSAGTPTDLATQLLGYVSQISAEAAGDARQGGLPAERRDRPVGRSRAEFNTYLRGVPGRRASASTRSGRPRSLRAPTPPTPGPDRPPDARHGLQRAAEKRSPTASSSRTPTAVGGRRRRDRRARPRDGSILALASSPTYKPSVYAGPRDARTLAAQGLTTKTALGEELPVARPRARGDVSAGLDVQAGDRDRGDAGAPGLPYALLSRAPGRTPRRTTSRTSLPQLGPVRQPADGPADGARVLVRHVLLPTRRHVLRRCRRTAAAAPELGPRSSASAG